MGSRCDIGIGVSIKNLTCKLAAGQWSIEIAITGPSGVDLDLTALFTALLFD